MNPPLNIADVCLFVRFCIALMLLARIFDFVIAETFFWERADWILNWFEPDWFFVSVFGSPIPEFPEFCSCNWEFEVLIVSRLFSAQFLICWHGAKFRLAKLLRMTLSIISRLFMISLIDATTNSLSYSLGILPIQLDFLTYSLLVPLFYPHMFDIKWNWVSWPIQRVKLLWLVFDLSLALKALIKAWWSSMTVKCFP